MNSTYFHLVILFCFKQLNGERTVSAIYHLLKGKKSSQTIQDGKLFNLSHLFSLFPRVSRQQVSDSCELLLQEGLIESISEKHYLLTPKGKLSLYEELNIKPIPANLNGWLYGDIGRTFWQRLSLLVQVLSNFVIERSTYLPVTKNQEDLQWVKRFLKQTHYHKKDLVENLYVEIKDTLQFQTNKEAQIFVQRLTSSRKIGQTFEQIAINGKEDPIYTYLLFWNVIHTVINQLMTTEDHSTIFNDLIKDKRQKNVLTSSTALTHSYLLQGFSLSEIATIRNLKESTIEDHIVEITLHDKSYSPDAFLSLAESIQINHAIDILQTHQLKQVKDYLHHQFTYFQIRLAYALNGRNG